MTASSVRLAVVTAGLGTPSASRLLADRLADSAVAALAAQGVAASVEVVELREHARDLADNLVTGFAGARLQVAIDTVLGADGVIVISPVFSASFSGLFKTFFDVLDPESLEGKPVLIGATGGSARHSLVTEHAIRPLLSYLRTVPVPTAVYAATEDFGRADADAALDARILRAGEQLASLVAGAVPSAAVPSVAGPSAAGPAISPAPETGNAGDSAGRQGFALGGFERLLAAHSG
ncbi:NADPH-dependent FMN reductase [Nakamurella sp. YIM 132087]|uniref:NADPH-dependent FMN reductase n=1 Tax=Nakamurella alba TaxID=2665158 RepID=A0A7K1FSX1_9ACTN|nr:CE1759 family FMN reductase [Nakamurella alba]MTD16489.1 NADPH-dependent FMN reductase [Nakamurella alba]